MKIYVASSWHNHLQQGVVAMLRGRGHQVYDFREHGFGWDEIDENWDSWTTHDYVTALRGFVAFYGVASRWRKAWKTPNTAMSTRPEPMSAGIRSIVASATAGPSSASPVRRSSAGSVESTKRTIDGANLRSGAGWRRGPAGDSGAVVEDRGGDG